MPLSQVALTTLQTVKDELRITDASDDVFIERLIDAASDAIGQYVGRTLMYDPALVETYPGTGTVLLLLRRYPVEEVTTIDYAGTTITDYDIWDDKAGILYRTGLWTFTGFLDSTIGVTPMPGTARKRWTITYKAGYVTPQLKADNPSYPDTDLPYDIEEACIKAAVSCFSQRGKDLSVTQVKALDGSDVRERKGLPSVVRDMLDPFRRR